MSGAVPEGGAHKAFQEPFKGLPSASQGPPRALQDPPKGLPKDLPSNTSHFSGVSRASGLPACQAFSQPEKKPFSRGAGDPPADPCKSSKQHSVGVT